MDTASPFEKIPASRDDRWHLMRNVIADWFTPLTPDDGYAIPSLPVELPTALREWYQLCGARSDIWSQQDHFYAPSELQKRDNFLIIIIENQSCAYWGIPVAELKDDDPPVYVKMSERDGWICENKTTTEFALQMLAFNIKWSDEMWWANGCGDQSTLEWVRKSYTRFQFPDWRWPVFPTHFYGTRDLIIETNGISDDIWFWISARTESVFQEFNDLIKPTGILWEAQNTGT